MRHFLYSVLCLFILCAPASAQQHILVEAEQFDCYGGWSLDQQFMEQMGSSYLLAHGSRVPVADAATSINIPKCGRYYIYARTYNWTSPFTPAEGPGKFRICIGGKALSPLGYTGSKWEWQQAGRVRLSKGATDLIIKDLTGFEGRVDAILLTTKALKEEQLNEFRPFPATAPRAKDAGHFDLVVIGGGYSGICASVAAAREGLKVALIQDGPYWVATIRLKYAYNWAAPWTASHIPTLATCLKNSHLPERATQCRKSITGMTPK